MYIIIYLLKGMHLFYFEYNISFPGSMSGYSPWKYSFEGDF